MHVSRDDIVEYLINHAGFTKDFTKGKSTDHLFGIYMDKINTAEKYRKEVMAFYQKHPEIQLRPTKDELEKMGFIRIRELRKKLGIPDILKKENRYKKHLSEVISYFREHPEITNHPSEEEIFELSEIELERLRKKFKITSKTQKVINIEPAIEAAQKAREIIKGTETAKLAADIIIQAETAEEYERDDYQFITLHEAQLMYGEEISDEFLESQGYKLYEPIGRSYSDTTERDELIAALLDIEITIEGKALDFDTLLKLDLEDLHYLYYISSRISETLEQKGPSK